MTIFQKDKERFFALMSSGNLAITQAVKEILLQGEAFGGINLWTAKNSHEAATVVGAAIKKVRERDYQSLQKSGIEFNCNLIFGGQVKDEKPRLFNIYAAGNFIETTPETPYFQIGESKYGKPILDRVIRFNTPLNLATKCVLISMDSTIKSNISVGLPLDLLVYENNSFVLEKLITIDEDNPYFEMMRDIWGEKLKEVALSIPEPSWNGSKKSISIVSTSKKLGPVPIQTPKTKLKQTKANKSIKARELLNQKRK
jgi:putative proteasome-type protease